MSETSDAGLLSLSEATVLASIKLGARITIATLEALANAHLLPSYPPLAPRETEKLVLRRDLLDLLPIIAAIQSLDCSSGPQQFYLPGVELPPKVSLGQDVLLPLGESLASDSTLACRPALRNLSVQVNRPVSPDQSDLRQYPFFGGTFLSTTRADIGEFAARQVSLSKLVDPERQPDFARSANYMGSKRRLGGFLAEILASKLPPGEGYVLDLMCGSGASTAAFNQIWPTYASDALAFCRLLAKVQGGGYSSNRAEETLAQVLPLAREHRVILTENFAPLIEVEHRLFHDDISPELLNRYKQFILDTPLFPSSNANPFWDPSLEVQRRQKNPTLHPYCLFSAYFANVYFGLRQCVEIDSLRAAIHALPNPEDQEWALGALVVAASSLATTYAAHFAQPALRKVDDLTLNRLASTLERRAQSIHHEFSVRLRNLAAHSEKLPRAVHLLPGPWEECLNRFAEVAKSKPAIVYLDAPYTRDEYSRYYHVLETLVRYSYPSSNGYGRVPERHTELFASEFFTKTQTKVEALLARIILRILRKGWMCAWSYSDSGSARIPVVVELIRTGHPSAIISSYAVPYTHKSHGRRKSKQVTEYLIVFESK